MKKDKLRPSTNIEDRRFEGSKEALKLAMRAVYQSNTIKKSPESKSATKRRDQQFKEDMVFGTGSKQAVKAGGTRNKKYR